MAGRLEITTHVTSLTCPRNLLFPDCDYCGTMLVDEATYVDGLRYQVSNDPLDGGHDSKGAGFTWVGLVNPSADEIDPYRCRFEIGSLAIEDALSGCQRPKLDVYEGQSCLVLKTVAYDPGNKRITVGDVSLIFAHDFVLSVRHGDAIRLHSCRVDLEDRPERLTIGPGVVVHEVVDRLVDQYLDVCHHLRHDVEVLEDMVFDDEIPVPATDLYFVKRELMEFRRAVLPLVEPLQRILTGVVPGIDRSLLVQFSDVLDHLRRVIDEVESQNELMSTALQANLTLIQVQQNADMRRISAWVGIGAVPTMVAGIYGMNFDYMPELGWRFGYFAVIGVLGLICSGLFLLFRKYRWL